MQYGEFGFLNFGLVLLTAAVLSVPIARRLGLSAIVAYLAGSRMTLATAVRTSKPWGAKDDKARRESTGAWPRRRLGHKQGMAPD